MVLEIETVRVRSIKAMEQERKLTQISLCGKVGKNTKLFIE